MKTALCLLGWLATADAGPLNDLTRAKTRAPRNEYCGSNFEEMGNVLTNHLRRSFERVRPCGEVSIEELRALQGKLFQVAEIELLQIYREVTDNRRERHDSVEAMKAHWDDLLASTPASTLPTLRDGLCHEVVMRFVHHTTDKVKEQLSEDTTFFLPTLPTTKHAHDGAADSLRAHQEYERATGCQACHSRLVPLPVPDTPKDCGAELKAKCGKRGVLMKEQCDACVAGASFPSCSTPEQISAWCDHPPACIGAETCPVWPTEFAAPFTLHSTVPSISGAKSVFYYKYDSEVQAQTVDYTEKCFPFVNARSFFSNLPCKLYFNPKGIYLSQPGRVDCCLFVADVGAAPPEFLQSFTLVGQDKDAPDMYGNQVKCDEWSGPSGFKYWTSGKNDPTYGNNVGHDILFQDGPTGVTWRWGNFTALPQGDLFTLPPGQCDQSCPKFLAEEELEAMHQDPHVKRTLRHHAILRSMFV